MNKSRETILNGLREAVSIPSELPKPPGDLDERIRKSLNKITPKDTSSLWGQFKDELERVSGEYFHVSQVEDALQIVVDVIKQNQYNKLVVTGEKVCQSVSDKLIQTQSSLQIIQSLELPHPERKQTLASIPAALVEAPWAIADIGSLVFPYDDTGTSLPHFLADCIIALVHTKNIQPNQFDFFKTLPADKAKNMVFVTGPSRTADIEKVLILGAHGPRRFVVIMYDF